MNASFFKLLLRDTWSEQYERVNTPACLQPYLQQSKVEATAPTLSQFIIGKYGTDTHWNIQSLKTGNVEYLM